MRQIEHQLLAAIAQQKSFKKSNTDYRLQAAQDPAFTLVGEVRLFGNHIASYMRVPPLLTISNCGWNTTTTNSRLNALLTGLTDLPAGIARYNNGRLIIGWIEHQPVIDLPMGRHVWYTLPSVDVLQLPTTATAFPVNAGIPPDDIDSILQLLPPQDFKATPLPFGATITATPFNHYQYLQDLRDLGRVPELVRMDRPSPDLLRPGIGSIWDRYRTASA